MTCESCGCKTLPWQLVCDPCAGEMASQEESERVRDLEAEFGKPKDKYDDSI